MNDSKSWEVTMTWRESILIYLSVGFMMLAVMYVAEMITAFGLF